VPGDRWNGLQVRLNELSAIGKPLVVGEVGMKAQQNLAGCMDPTEWSAHIRAKMAVQFSAGVSGYLLWEWMTSNGGGCVYEDITAADPLLGLMRNYQT
ncbi:MAG: mannan endo,4-beta-mannosidase, partial [Actinomycetota bacterium]|nr:mannan endo,4-beta-mannosidase [Actinomycetota bacterium]